MSLCIGKKTILLLALLAMGLSPVVGAETPAPSEPQVLTNDVVTIEVLKASLSKTQNLELTLPHALQMAQEGNPMVISAKADVRASRAQYQTRLAEMLPDLRFSLQEVTVGGGAIMLGGNTFNINRTNYIPQVVFNFPIFHGGRHYFQYRAAKKSFESQQATSNGTEQQTLQQTALRYYDMKRAMEQIRIAQQTLTESQTQLEMNNSRMEAGVGTRLEVLQSQAQLARARQDLLEAVQNSELAALQLNELLDLPAIVSVVPAETGQQMLTLVPDAMALPAILTLANQHRPDLLAVNKQIQSLQELRKVAWSAFLPEISLQARTGGIGPSLGNLSGFSLSGYSIDFNFTNLAVPALTLYKQNTAQLESLQARLEAQINTAERELSEAALRSMTQRSKVATVRAELAASEQALADAMERMNVGVGRYLDVLNAETTLTRARSNLSATILEYNQAQVNLVSAMGLASVQSLTQGIQVP